MALYLLARVAEQVIAFAAEQIGSVVDLGTVVPVPRAAPHIAGLYALRSRVLTVIDTEAAILPDRRQARLDHAIVVDVGGHGYALAVTQVDDVVDAPDAQPCTAALDLAWARIVRGMIEVEGRAILLVDTAALIEGAAATKVVELT